VVCLAPRAPGDSVRPRRLAGVGARPLNFTVRGHSQEIDRDHECEDRFVRRLGALARRAQRAQQRAPILPIGESCSGVTPTPSLFGALGALWLDYVALSCARRAARAQLHLMRCAL
jgi:hypothetical protein